MKRLGNPGESGVNPTALCRLLYSAGRREETNAPVNSERVRPFLYARPLRIDGATYPRYLVAGAARSSPR